MNTTHLHLLLNHFPVIGSMIGSMLLLWGILKKQDNIKTTAAFILILMTLIAVPVFLTGEPAEESVEKLPGVSETMISLHEEAATLATWLMAVTGIAGIVAIFFQWQKRSVAGKLFAGLFILSAISFAAMARAGYYGGQIRHSEIRNGSAAYLQEGNEQGKGTEDNSNKKDDD